MTEPEPATPAEAGPGGDPVPPADPVPPGDPVPPVEPAPSPDAVPAAATAAGTRALRPQFDAEAKTALAELLAAGADCPPGLADPDAATAPKTWADTVRASVRRAVGTALAEAVTPDEPVQPVEPVGDRAGRAAVRRRHHVGGARLRAHLHPPDRPEPALVRVLVGAPGGDRAAPSALADLKGRPGGLSGLPERLEPHDRLRVPPPGRAPALALADPADEGGRVDVLHPRGDVGAQRLDRPGLRPARPAGLAHPGSRPRPARCRPPGAPMPGPCRPRSSGRSPRPGRPAPAGSPRRRPAARPARSWPRRRTGGAAPGYPRRWPPRVPGRCATSSTPRPRPRWPSCWPPARTARRDWPTRTRRPPRRPGPTRSGHRCAGRSAPRWPRP